MNKDHNSVELRLYNSITSERCSYIHQKTFKEIVLLTKEISSLNSITLNKVILIYDIIFTNDR